MSNPFLWVRSANDRGQGRRELPELQRNIGPRGELGSQLHTSRRDQAAVVEVLQVMLRAGVSGIQQRRVGSESKDVNFFTGLKFV